MTLCKGCLWQYQCSGSKNPPEFCTPFKPIPEGFMRIEDMPDPEEQCKNCDLFAAYNMKVILP